MYNSVGRPGDVFLLFRELPYSFDEDLPLQLGPNAYIDKIPQEVLDVPQSNFEHEQIELCSLINYVLPGYHLNLGYTNCCLRSPIEEYSNSEYSPLDIFFLSINGLRLCAPYKISVAGSFKLGKSDSPITEYSLYWLESPWVPKKEGLETNLRYTPENVRLCNEIVNRLIELNQSSYARFVSGLVLFSHVTCGFTNSYQMAYSMLFASLEALFYPTGSGKGQTLARRVDSFLSTTETKFSIKDFIQNEYRSGRNIVHGLQDISVFQKLNDEKKQKLGRLHEITRLCILGFMSMGNDNLQSYTSKTGPTVKKLLDNIKPACGKFIDGQRIWIA